MKNLVFSTLFIVFIFPTFSYAQSADNFVPPEDSVITETEVITPFPGVNDGQGIDAGFEDPTLNQTELDRSLEFQPLPPAPPTIVPYSGREDTTSLNAIDTVAPASTFGGQPLNQLLNQIFYIGLAIAVVLAIVMIVRGGVQYMTIDAASSKDSGKKMVQAALGGLVLAFASILILNTINPNLTELNINFQRLSITGTSGGGSSLTTGPRVEVGNFGSWDEASAEAWIKGLESGTRSTDGRLVVSVYSASGDAVTDSNTAARRGNADNLLREGSVALSPDLIQLHKPQHGAEIFINGQSIGFYEDTTASEYNGVQFRNTIDIYDENVSLGSRNILNNIPAGEWNISFGAPRPQISNPSN